MRIKGTTPCMICIEHPQEPESLRITALMKKLGDIFNDVLCYKISWRYFQPKYKLLDKSEYCKISFYKDSKFWFSKTKITEQELYQEFEKLQEMYNLIDYKYGYNLIINKRNFKISQKRKKYKLDLLKYNINSLSPIIHLKKSTNKKKELSLFDSSNTKSPYSLTYLPKIDIRNYHYDINTKFLKHKTIYNNYPNTIKKFPENDYSSYNMITNFCPTNQTSIYGNHNHSECQQNSDYSRNIQPYNVPTSINDSPVLNTQVYSILSRPLQNPWSPYFTPNN